MIGSWKNSAKGRVIAFVKRCFQLYNTLAVTTTAVKEGNVLPILARIWSNDL